ncbi:MAG: DUF1553 domain-containing protein [Planctomycetaceae bacterium]|jgi:hypothetical protein
MFRLRLLLFLAVPLLLASDCAAFADDLFEQQVAPLLERRCLSCHNSVDRRGNFSLQSAETLLQSGHVVAGQPDDSQLLTVVTSQNGKPPEMPGSGPPLTDAEVLLLRRWIQQGAAWPAARQLQEPVVSDFGWWSFQPLNKPPVPAFSDTTATAWIRNPVDAFILQSLRQAGLQPSPAASRRTLIRRLSFDLLGLPPQPAEIEAFVNDPDPQAWEKLVDRYLASPQYGEHWARHWLDVVRYADTCGYDKDKLRPNAWPYRDYVISSLNADKPWDRFVQEQIAGDVLFPGTADGILGLGFIAAGPWDFIGHVEVPEAKIDGKVARNIDRDDMVTGTLNAFCSLTVQCARCHNHKFDPFTQQHYYGLQAVFAAVDRAERPWGTDPQTEQQRAQLQTDRKQAQQDRDQLQAEIRKLGGQQLTDLEQQVAQLKPKAQVAPKQPEFGYHSAITDTDTAAKWVQVDLGTATSLQQIVLHPCHDEFAGIGSGFGFPVRFRIEVSQQPPQDAAVVWNTVLDQTASDFPNPGLLPVTAVTDQPVRLIRVTATRLAKRSSDYIFALAELEALRTDGSNAATGAVVSALDSIEAPVRWGKNNLVDGHWPNAADPAAELQLAHASKELTRLMSSLLTAERQQKLDELTTAINSADSQLAALPAGRMVYAAATHFNTQGNFIATQGKPREIRLLHRGNETQPRELVVPGTVPLSAHDEFRFQLPEGHTEGDRRAALARWITRPEHPLTWRSIVNRVWQYHFGRGLVDSPNDFGRMGQTPTHPELLDWLAGQFLQERQSLKSLHRMLLLSNAWQQSAEQRDDALTVDAENHLLWRMNRRRLTAEELRDAVLMVSGALDTKMGGPGFYLFALEKTDHSPHYEYHKFDPADPQSHRRSVYRFIVRSQPDPFMTTLDCADSSQSTPRRHETLTPLQALSLLNNKFNLVMSQRFADRIRQESATDEQRVLLAFQLVTGRHAEPAETAEMLQYAAAHGWPALCRLLLNLNEFVFVE